ncbi:MAG TPA: hypothetical protein VEQ59_24570 [Polyangiaceae bacterium]|nr:hypothetical protein [Polyangiaceae bacterium]
MRQATSMGCALALGLLASSSLAEAQPKQDDYSYFFDADNVRADTFGAPPPLLRVRPNGPRVLLIRPRVSFAAELISSLDAL